MWRAGTGFADALRQHGGTPEAFPRRDWKHLALGRTGGQTRGGVHLDEHAARWAGEHVDLDDASAAPSRHADRRPPLHGARPLRDRERRHALRCKSPGARCGVSAPDRSGEAACRCFGQAPGASRITGRSMSYTLATLMQQRAALCARMSWLGLTILCFAWEAWLAPLQPGGSWMILK